MSKTFFQAISKLITYSTDIMKSLATWSEPNRGKITHWDLWGPCLIDICNESYRKTVDMLKLTPFAINWDVFVIYIDVLRRSIEASKSIAYSRHHNLATRLPFVFKCSDFPIPILCPAVLAQEDELWCEVDVAIEEVRLVLSIVRTVMVWRRCNTRLR
jgi:hypothetical protein